MNSEGLVAVVVAAVLLFWAVGAWNRLVELRNRVAEAWAQVAVALARRDEVAEPLIQNLRGLLAGEDGAIGALQSAHTRTLKAAAALGVRPLDPALAAEWAAAQAALAAAAARAFALLDGTGAAGREPPLPQLLAAWREGAAAADFARQLFNREAAAYDEARTLFPTSLLARSVGFGPAGRI
jgi:LemA protein